MSQRRAIILALIAGMPLALLVSPEVKAAVATTEVEKDVWNQIAAPITGANSGAQTTDGLILLTGQAYYLYVGTNAAFGTIVNAGSSVGATDLFTIDKNGALTRGALGANAELVSMINTSQTYNPFYAIIRVTPSSTTNYYLSTNSGGFGNPGSLSSGWSFPPGDSGTHLGVSGYAGAWHPSGNANVEIAHAVKCCPQQVSEAGALSEVSKTTAGIWDDAKATWARINPAKYQHDTSTSSGANDPSTAQAATREAYQSFLPDASLGGYLERFTLFMSTARNGGTGIIRVAIFSGTSAPTLPVDLTQARASVEFTYSQTIGCGCAASARYIVNWTAGSVTTSDVSGATSASATGITWREYGVATLTPKAVNVLLSNPATDRIYVYVYYTLNADGTYSSSGLSQITSNPVTTGQYCTASGGTWNCANANYDLSGMQIGLYGGQSITQYSLAATPQTHGGAIWTYVREKKYDSDPQQYTFFTSFGGRAKAGSFQFANATHVIQEWRLGYLTFPYNNTETFTIDANTTGSGSNVVEVATFVSQTNTAHWHKVLFAGGILGFATIQVFSTDDYFTSVTFQVKECLDQDCGTLGALANASAYLVQVCTGPFSRTINGNVDANASFTIMGQDIPLCAMTITLTGSGYAKTLWSITIQSSGRYQYTLGIFKTGTVTVAPTLGAVSLTFEGNATRTIPDRVQINITRSRSASLFVGASHIDGSTGVVQNNVVRATFWDASSSNAFNFYYPTRTKSGPQDKGGYILWVINDTGIVLGYSKFFLEPVGTSWTTDDFTITSDMLQGISQAGYTSAQQAYQQSFQASILAQQKTVRDQVYDDFQTIHNYGFVFIVLLGILAIVRAFRR